MRLISIDPEQLYQKDPNIKREDVKTLQEWLRKQPHLPKIEESQAIIFLHSCCYSIQATKRTIDCYFTRRTRHPEIFRYPSADRLNKALPISLQQYLPRKTPEGYRVLLKRLMDVKVEYFNFTNEIMLINLIIALSIHKHGISEGLVSVFDFQGVALGHLARVNLSVLKCALDHLQEGLPVRVKGIHVINAVPFMDKILALVKPFLQRELYEMIHIHSSFDSLYKYIPKECLPSDYGGELPSCQVFWEELKKDLFDNAQFFQWHDSQAVDELKRMEKSTVLDSTLGVDGTFKKLEID